MREVMSNAWRFFKVTGESFADCLKRAWQVYKLAKEMKKRTVQFFYQKVNGEIRTAWGTLKADLIPDTACTDNRKKNDSVMVYYDQEKASFRCFKIANFVKMI